MKSSHIKNVLSLIIILVMGALIKIITQSESMVFNIIIIGFLFITLNALLQVVFKNSSNKIISLIKNGVENIAGIFTLIIMYIRTYGVGVMTIILIFGALFIMMFQVDKYIFGGIINYKSIIYLSSLLTFIILSYRGSKILDIFIKLTSDTKGILSGFSNYKAIEYFTKINFRKLCYEISIILYVLTKVINLSEFKFLNKANEQLISSLVAEVFLTFVAIDSYISTFKKDIIERNILEKQRFREEYLEKFNIEYDKYTDI